MSKNRGQTNTTNFNIGDWLSAKIYSDMKTGCSCGNKEWSSEPIRGLPDYSVPICPKCENYPSVFVIVATVKDEHGLVKRIRVRHSQEGKRLKDYLDVVYTLRCVTREIDTQTFDVRKYESEESRESYVFENIVAEYLAHHEAREKRGELSPAGLKDKKTLIKNHLMPTFEGIDIGHISDQRIRKFFNSYTESLRMRDKATSELKTIFYFVRDELKKIQFIPSFPEISAARMITADNFLDEKKQAIVISKISNPLYQYAIKTMAIYGLRPCDVRSLKWSDIDFTNMIFHIRSHASLGKDIPGRKSQKDVVHTLPISNEFYNILKNIPRSIKLSDYVFKGEKGGMIGGNVLTRAWNDACKIAKVKGVKMYWGTKHSTLSNLGKELSDAQIIKLTGHTNTKIIRRYNQSNIEEIRKILN